LRSSLRVSLQNIVRGVGYGGAERLCSCQAASTRPLR
jgi:hypothetical protein